MCPVCITTAALIAGSFASTGGLAVVAMKRVGVKKSGVKNAAATHPTPTQSKENRHD